MTEDQYYVQFLTLGKDREWISMSGPFPLLDLAIKEVERRVKANQTAPEDYRIVILQKRVVWPDQAV